MKKIVNCPHGQDGIVVVNQIDERQYRDAKGLNKSLLVKFMKSPRHYLAALNERSEPTDSMRLGTSLHAELFRDEPKNEYAVSKKVDNRTKEGKEYTAEFNAKHAGKAIISEDQDVHLKGMMKSLMGCNRFKKMYEATTHKEMGIFADYISDAHNPFRMKGMLDGYIESEGVIYDVKTTQDASFDKFRWDFNSFAYGLQQVHYTDLLVKTGLEFRDFVFVVVENKAPYNVAYYQLSREKYGKVRGDWNDAMEYYGILNDKQDFDIGFPNGTYQID